MEMSDLKLVYTREFGHGTSAEGAPSGLSIAENAVVRSDRLIPKELRTASECRHSGPEWVKMGRLKHLEPSVHK